MHVLLLTLTGSNLSSDSKSPAKSVSAYRYNWRFPAFGLIIRPLPLVPLRCLTIYILLPFRAKSCVHVKNENIDGMHAKYLDECFQLGIKSYLLWIYNSNLHIMDLHQDL